MPNTLILNLGANDDHSNSDLSGKSIVLHVLYIFLVYIYFVVCGGVEKSKFFVPNLQFQ